MSSNDSSKALTEAGWRSRDLPGFAGHVGPLWTRKEGDAWAYGLLAAPQHLNTVGIVHGGLLTTLIDHALSAIAWTSIAQQPCVTVQLDTQFLSSAKAGDFLEARGRVLKATSSLVFVQGQIEIAGVVCVSATSLMKIVGPRPGSAPAKA